MGAEVARQIEELDGGEVGRGDALEDLLVGRIGRLGRAPVLADQRLDRRPIDNVERVERAAAIVARIDGRRPSKSAKRLCFSAALALSLADRAGLPPNATASQDPNEAEAV
jgi:hypothetical protein